MLEMLCSIAFLTVLFIVGFIVCFAPFFLCKRVILFRFYCALFILSTILCWMYPVTFRDGSLGACALGIPTVLICFLGWGEFFLRKA